MIDFPNKFIAGTREYTTIEKHVNAPYFRKKFSFSKGKEAKIRICGLGFYELYINGENIKITAYNKANGNLNADGNFYEIKYNVKKKPLIKRIFK